MPEKVRTIQKNTIFFLSDIGYYDYHYLDKKQELILPCNIEAKFLDEHQRISKAKGFQAYLPQEKIMDYIFKKYSKDSKINRIQEN